MKKKISIATSLFVVFFTASVIYNLDHPSDLTPTKPEYLQSEKTPSEFDKEASTDNPVLISLDKTISPPPHKKKSDVMSLAPHEAYEKYITSAEGGSTESQFYMSVILERCLETSSIRNEEDLDQIDMSGEISEDFINDIKNIYQKCKKLYEILGDVDINELRSAWLERASSEGHIVAMLVSLLELSKKTEKEQVLTLLYTAFEESNGNPVVEATLYNAALLYYAKYIEPTHNLDAIIESGHYRRGVDRDAWDYLACKFSFDCDFENFMKSMNNNFHEYEINDMLERVDAISNAIAKSNWEELGLENIPEKKSN